MSFSINANISALENDFISKFGSYASKYDKLTPLGENKYGWIWLVVFLLLCASILFLDLLKNQLIKLL